MSNAVIDRILGIEGIETIGAFQSEAMGAIGGSSSANSMSLYILLDENRNISNDEIKRQIDELTKDLDCTVVVSTSTVDMSAIGGSGLEVVIKGREIDTLRDISDDIVNC